MAHFLSGPRRSILISLLATVSTGSLLLIAAIAGPIVDPEWLAGVLTAVEKAVGLISLALAAFLIYKARESPEELWQSRYRVYTPSVLNDLLVFLPCLPWLGSLLIIDHQLYESLFLGDQDFTSVSEALNNTALGRGLLHTPYVDTGARGSFLGHHFAPGLLLYVPFYFVAHLVEFLARTIGLGALVRPTHFLYAHLLWLTLGAGMYLWARYFAIELRSVTRAVVVMTLLMLNVPLWRLALSFHWEIMVLPASALAFLGLQRRSRWQYMAGLLLWLSVKEDMAIYAFLLGLFLLSDREKGNHSFEGAATCIISLLYFGITRELAMPYFRGTEAILWDSYWAADLPRSSDAWPSFKLLLAFGLLPLLNVRLTVLVLAPILLLHYFSRQPWHHDFMGHYCYSILPFLLAGFSRGLNRLFLWNERFGTHDYRPATVSLLLFVVMLTAAWDRLVPFTGRAPAIRHAIVRDMLGALPDDTCVQMQASFSALAPLAVRVFPIAVPASNPYSALVPGPGNFDSFYFGPETPCRDYLLLIDPADIRPQYDAETLARLLQYADRNLTLESAANGLWVYGLSGLRY